MAKYRHFRLIALWANTSRLELSDKLFAHNEPTYNDLATVVKLIVQIAFHRLQMSQVPKTEHVAISVC